METRRLGRTNLELSVLSIGGLYTSSLAGGESETRRIMQRAMELIGKWLLAQSGKGPGGFVPDSLFVGLLHKTTNEAPLQADGSNGTGV